jgi:hypothetical protein
VVEVVLQLFDSWIVSKIDIKHIRKEADLFSFDIGDERFGDEVNVSLPPFVLRSA